MRRWLFNLATAVSLGLCVLVLLLWLLATVHPISCESGEAPFRRMWMLLEEDATSRRPLHYARPLLAPVRSTYMMGIGAVVLIAGAVAAWCVAHTVQVIVEVEQVVRSRPIDFDPSYLGMPVEKSIPLGILSGGVALVSLVHFVRLWNSRKVARPAVLPDRHPHKQRGARNLDGRRIAASRVEV